MSDGHMQQSVLQMEILCDVFLYNLIAVFNVYEINLDDQS